MCHIGTRQTVEKHAGELFRDAAKAFVLTYLKLHGATAGEVLTEACCQAGIVPHDTRAFGPIYMTLARQGVIEKCGSVARRLGHGTAGGNIWRVTR